MARNRARTASAPGILGTVGVMLSRRPNRQPTMIPEVGFAARNFLEVAILTRPSRSSCSNRNDGSIGSSDRAIAVGWWSTRDGELRNAAEPEEASPR
jgi:hypothetical protein